MRKFTIWLSCLLLFTSVLANAQSKVITGTVTGAGDGMPIPGVTVMVPGTTTGTTTDFDGNYELSIDEGVTSLRFSYVGMETQDVEIGDKTVINVELSISAALLDEVVVTALGVTREKKALGYSVQDVSGDEISKAKETNIVNSLQGRVSGAQITSTSGAVGASSRIVLRGVASLGGDNQPLFIIDGVPIDNSAFSNSGNSGVNLGNGASDINPDDVESISTLKGPVASAIYGSRASNGVIVITTKRGGKQKGLGISANTTITIENPLRLPDYQNKYGQGTQGKFSFVNGRGGGINDGTDESWGPELDIGLLIPQFYSNGVAVPWVSHPDNIKNFFRRGVTRTSNIAIQGGGSETNFRLSYTQMDQWGTVPNTEFNRRTISFNGMTTSPNKKMTLTASGSYIRTFSDNMPGYGYAGQNVMQQFIWFGRQVDISRLKQRYLNPDGTPFNWNYNYHNNPYFTVNENLNKIDRDRILGNVMLKYQFTDFLSAYIRSGGDYYNNLNTRRRALYDQDFPHGYYREEILNLKEFNSDFLVTFDKDITDNFELTLNFGGNRLDRVVHNNFLEAGELAVPNIYNIANSAIPIVADNFSSRRRVESLYGFGQIAFKRALYLDFSLRNDWSSALPAANNSYMYPSVSGSAVLTDLFDLKNNILSFAKLRLGWARVGGDTDPYSLEPVVRFGDGWNGADRLLNLYVPDVLPNADLKPQFTNSFEAGFDLRLFLDRLSLDVTYYSSISKDQILEVAISNATGYSSKAVNAGRIDNKGIEVQLNIIPIKTKDFQWDMKLNFAKNDNKVVELIEGVDRYVLGTYWSLSVMAIPGEKYGSLFGYDYERDEDGNVIFIDGLPQQGDLRILGNYTPDWLGGIYNQFTYKSLSASFLIDVRQGGDMYSMTTTWGRYAGVLEETLIGREGGIVGDGVMPDGNGGYIPNNVVATAEDFNKAFYRNDVAAGSIFDASYIKLREVRIGYTFPDFKNIPIKDLNVSIVGRNLAILSTKVPHIDPESAFNNTNVQGLEFGQIPTNRSYGFNISFKF